MIFFSHKCHLCAICRLTMINQWMVMFHCVTTTGHVCAYSIIIILCRIRYWSAHNQRYWDSRVIMQPTSPHILWHMQHKKWASSRINSIHVCGLFYYLFVMRQRNHAIPHWYIMECFLPCTKLYGYKALTQISVSLQSSCIINIINTTELDCHSNPASSQACLHTLKWWWSSLLNLLCQSSHAHRVLCAYLVWYCLYPGCWCILTLWFYTSSL